MKKTLLSTAVIAGLTASFSAAAAPDILNGPDNSIGAAGGAQTVGALSPATNAPSSSYNAAVNNSLNTNLKDFANEVNTANKVDIKEDGNVIYAQDANQAVASSDLDALVSNNQVAVDGGYTKGALSPVTDEMDNNSRTTTNTISASFSGAAGVAVVSQNTGHASSIQQSTVVQSNFRLN